MLTTQRLNRMVIISLIWFSLSLSLRTGVAQEQMPSVPTQIYLLRDNQIRVLDLATTSQELVVAEIMPPNTFSSMSPKSDQIDRRSLAADIDSQAKYAYLIEGWGRSTNRWILNLPTGAELIQLDLATGSRKVIFDQTTVFNFVLSPDESRMIVFFYTGEYMYSTQHACILDLQTLVCQLLRFDNMAIAFWIDNDTFLTRIADVNPLQLVDASTGLSVSLTFPPQWYIYWASSIPKTNILVTSALIRESATAPVSFLTYNIDTGDVQVLPYTAPNTNDYLTVGNLQMSPDGQFLLYGGGKTSLVEYNTGRLIQEFNLVVTADWLDNHTLLIQGSQDGTQFEVFQFDAISGQSKTLLSGDAAAGVLLVP